MSDWPIVDGPGQAVALGYNGASCYGVDLTSGGSAGTKGDYVEFTAATPFHAKWMILQSSYGYGAVSFHCDIAAGAAGSEVVIVPNFIHEGPTETLQIGHLMVPVSIPAGTRLSARCASSYISAKICQINIILLSGGFSQQDIARPITCYGSVASTASGTTIDPGATVDTKGAWVQITPATTQPCKMVVVQIDGLRDSSRTSASWRIDIGIGSAGNEVVAIPDILCVANVTIDCIRPKAFPVMPFSVPLGTRISVRAQSDINDANRNIGISLYLI